MSHSDLANPTWGKAMMGCNVNNFIKVVNSIFQMEIQGPEKHK